MLTLSLHVTPKAKRSEILGWVQDAEGRPVLKLKVAAPPEDGRANEEVISLLARTLKLPKSAISLERGAASRHKTVKIADESAASRLRAYPAVTKA